jgi:probable HAF family extracellular repeat protein
MPRSFAITCLALCALSSSAYATEATFAPLGDLEGGIFRSFAYAVSADGSVIVGESVSAHGYEAFRWESGGMTGLGLPTGLAASSVARGVSADGAIVVGWDQLGNYSHPFRWTVADGKLPLGFLDPAHEATSPYGISADGSVIVGRGEAGGTVEAFRWEDGAFSGLGDLPGGNVASEGMAVSADGSVVAGFGRSGSGTEAFRWTAIDGMQGLGDLPGSAFGSSAFAVSGDGQTIAGWSNASAGTEAFRWSAATGMVSLGVLPDAQHFSIARGMSADGTIIVGESKGSANRTVFVWDPAHGMRDLARLLVDHFEVDLTGWQLRQAMAVTPDGRTIVGWGRNPQGDYEAWRVQFRCAENPADDDHDGDFDLDDFARFQACTTGAGDVGTTFDPFLCGCFDVNGDRSIDRADFDAVEPSFSGP